MTLRIRLRSMSLVVPFFIRMCSVPVAGTLISSPLFRPPRSCPLPPPSFIALPATPAPLKPHIERPAADRRVRHVQDHDLPSRDLNANGFSAGPAFAALRAFTT